MREKKYLLRLTPSRAESSNVGRSSVDGGAEDKMEESR